MEYFDSKLYDLPLDTPIGAIIRTGRYCYLKETTLGQLIKVAPIVLSSRFSMRDACLAVGQNEGHSSLLEAALIQQHNKEIALK